MAPTANSTRTSRAFPDDESTKAVLLQVAEAPGERRAWLCWANGELDAHCAVHYVVQLERHDGTYFYYEPNVVVRAPGDARGCRSLVLGHFTREQRERILELAADVPFAPRSLVNGCGAWMRALLSAMVHDYLIPNTTFLAACDLGSLPRAQQEQIVRGRY